jgi:hypothetical protein
MSARALILVLGLGFVAAFGVGTRSVVSDSDRWDATAPPVAQARLVQLGALARRLPTTTPAGWRLALTQVDARHGVYVVEAVPPAAGRTTMRQATRVLASAARTAGDDPDAYRALIPMSALAGSRSDGR